MKNAREDILAQERLSLDRWAAGDPEGYAENAAADVTYFDDIGASARVDGLDACVAYLASLQIPPHSYEIVHPNVQVYGDVGILTLHYHGLAPSGEVASRWKATVVYRRDAEGWHKVHAHWSEIRSV